MDEKTEITVKVRKDYLELIDNFSVANNLTREKGLEMFLYIGFVKANEMINKMKEGEKNGTKKTKRKVSGTRH